MDTMTNQIMFVTGNMHKVAEAVAICAPRGIAIVQNDCGYPELQDNDVARVAEYGAEHVVNRLDCAVIVEDTGLYIDALNGFPGPYAAYVYDTIGNAGILALMRDIDEADDRSPLRAQPPERLLMKNAERGDLATIRSSRSTASPSHRWVMIPRIKCLTGQNRLRSLLSGS